MEPATDNGIPPHPVASDSVQVPALLVEGVLDYHPSADRERRK